MTGPKVIRLIYVKKPCAAYGGFSLGRKGGNLRTRGGQQLETFDRATLVQSLERSQLSGIQDTRLTPGFQERYVRFGIGGAGNMRKSCFPFLGVHGLSNLLYLELTDIIFLKQSTFS